MVIIIYFTGYFEAQMLKYCLQTNKTENAKHNSCFWSTFYYYKLTVSSRGVVCISMAFVLDNNSVNPVENAVNDIVDAEIIIDDQENLEVDEEEAPQPVGIEIEVVEETPGHLAKKRKRNPAMWNKTLSKIAR